MGCLAVSAWRVIDAPNRTILSTSVLPNGLAVGSTDNLDGCIGFPGLDVYVWRRNRRTQHDQVVHAVVIEIAVVLKPIGQ